MATVYHPTLTGVQRDVPDADVERWQESGWLGVGPSEVSDAATAADKGQRPKKKEVVK